MSYERGMLSAICITLIVLLVFVVNTYKQDRYELNLLLNDVCTMQTGVSDHMSIDMKDGKTYYCATKASHWHKLRRTK